MVQFVDSKGGRKQLVFKEEERAEQAAVVEAA
jgi:hypothetical protein